MLACTFVHSCTIHINIPNQIRTLLVKCHISLIFTDNLILDHVNHMYMYVFLVRYSC